MELRGKLHASAAVLPSKNPWFLLLNRWSGVRPTARRSGKQNGSPYHPAHKLNTIPIMLSCFPTLLGKYLNCCLSLHLNILSDFLKIEIEHFWVVFSVIGIRPKSCFTPGHVGPLHRLQFSTRVADSAMVTHVTNVTTWVSLSLIRLDVRIS
jgi:hypothetical protein